MSDDLLRETREIANGYTALNSDLKALSQRVDYLHVAVMRGDPRFAKAEYAKTDFDCEAFDREWAARGKRVPTMEEVFG